MVWSYLKIKYIAGCHKEHETVAHSDTSAASPRPLQSPLLLLGDLLVADYTHAHTHTSRTHTTHERTHSYIKHVSNIYVVSIYAR